MIRKLLLFIAQEKNGAKAGVTPILFHTSGVLKDSKFSHGFILIIFILIQRPYGTTSEGLFCTFKQFIIDPFC